MGRAGSFSRRVAALVTCAVAFGIASSLLSGSESGLAKLDPVLQQRASTLHGTTRVIIRARDATALPLLQPLIEQAGGRGGRLLSIVNSRAATLPNAALATVASSGLVGRISIDRVIAGALERTSGATGAAAVRQQFGYDGAGIGVAVIDSGVSSWHDDLADASGGVQRVDRFVDFVNGRTSPYDDHGHGTHVAGIIAGNGFDSGGARTGIAPAARLIVLKVLDSAGRGRISDVIAALGYVVEHKDALGIRVVNLSVAAQVFESYNTDPLTLAARAAVDRGIVVVAAAGNAGRDAAGRTRYRGITAPGNAPWVLTVGASSHMGTADRIDDEMAVFSSRGPTAVDTAAKPDIVAPGVGIESLSDPASAFYSTKAPYLLDGTVPTSYLPYLSLSGTSMAAPVASGTIALMLQANPTLTPNAVKAVLQYTAETYAGYDRLTQGAGFLNARGAVELARYLASPSSPYPDSTTWTRRLIWGNYLVRGGRLMADANAWGPGVNWGATAAPGGEPVAWGSLCAEEICEDGAGRWEWGAGRSRNVVWGATCGGADCTTTWSPAASAADAEGETVVWGTDEDGETVVWGTDEDGETVVWGTGDEGETVVWGTGDDGDTVVWGTSCTDPGCEPVVWDTP